MQPVSGRRPRNAEATRAAILEAARSRFADQGYDGASLRDIAAEAGVDVALVSRYFGSKDELFRASLQSVPPDELFAGEASHFGARVARMLILEPLDQGKLDKLLMILRSAASPRAAEIIRLNGEESFYGPLQALLGGEDAAVRARLVAALTTGMAILRAIDESYLLTSSDREELSRRFAALVQGVVETR